MKRTTWNYWCPTCGYEESFGLSHKSAQTYDHPRLIPCPACKEVMRRVDE